MLIFCTPNLYIKKKKIKLKRLFIRGCFIEWIIELFFFNFDPDCVEYDEEIKSYPITSSGSAEVASAICYDQVDSWEKGTVLRNILFVITSGLSVKCHRGRPAHTRSEPRIIFTNSRLRFVSYFIDNLVRLAEQNLCYNISHPTSHLALNYDKRSKSEWWHWHCSQIIGLRL